MKLGIRTKLLVLLLGVLAIAVSLISYRQLTFFQADKETYIYDLISQVVTAQADELERQVTSLQDMMLIFADFDGYQFASIAQKQTARNKLLKKLKSFYSVTLFSSRGQRNTKPLTVAKEKALQTAKVSGTDLLKQGRKMLADKKLESGKLIAFNFTQNPQHPVAGVFIKVNRTTGVIGLVPRSLLSHTANKKSIYNSYLVDRSGSLVVHDNGSLLVKQSDMKEVAIVASYMANPRFPQTKEFISQRGENMLGAHANIPGADLGLIIEIPKATALLAAKRLIKASLFWAGGIFLLASFIGILFANALTKPLKRLSAMTKAVARGDFHTKTEVTSGDEIGQLGSAFNKMSDELDVREKELENTHRQLVQSEKMGAFGQMSAGIAHEVKNPLAGILGYAQLAKNKVKDDSITKYLDIIEKETKRCKDIIENLMKFARAEKTEYSPIDISQVVSEAITLVDHQITLNGVKIVQELAEEGQLPQVSGNANQIQQVLMNLMLNAQHAMKEGGTLTVRTGRDEQSNGEVFIDIADTGEGIAAENLQKIFEPFFTTKPAGKGTGLGLAVSYGIIRDHKGDIKVESEVGVGTKFTIVLPNKGIEGQEAAAPGSEAKH